MDKRWWLFWACVIVFGIAVGYNNYNADQKAEYLRGWESPTEQKAMPYRGLGQSIGGVNVELIQYESEAELNHQLDQIAALGFTWVRQPIYWEYVEPEQGQWDWAAYDRVIEAVAAHPQLQLIAVLDGTPRWARDPMAVEHPFAPPASVADYTAFVREFTQRYHPSVDYYQIWDEPNIREHWGNLDPRAAHYVAMLKNAYTTIHSADNKAMVITAALAPNTESGPENISDILYLKAIYDLGGSDSFDAAAGKPYGFDLPPDDRTVDWGVLNFSRLILLREEMVARGDGHKPLWGSNFGWNHLPDNWQGPPSRWGQVSAETQLQYTRDAFQRAEREWSWCVGLIVQHWQPDVPLDDPLQGFALVPQMERWLADAPWVTGGVLIPGLYRPEQPMVDYGGNWAFGESGADALYVGDDSIANTMRIPFEGNEFALLVNRDNYTAYLLVTIDGENANALPINQQGESFIILTSATRQPSQDLIKVATDLQSGRHEAVITHYHRMGEDYWSIAGFAVNETPNISQYTWADQITWAIALVAIVMALVVGIRLPWRNLKMPSRQTLQDGGDLLLTLAMSGIFIVGAALSWGDTFTQFFRRDPPALLLTVATVGLSVYSPMVWFGLLGLMGFGVIVFNRPLMGLLAVAFWATFFTTTIDTYFRLFNAVEILLLITALATIGRGLVEIVRVERANRDAQPIVLLIGQVQTWLYTKLHALDLLMIGFCGLAIYSISWADLRPEALRELRAMVLGPAAFYFLIRLNNLDKRGLVLVVDAALLGGVTMALVGLYNYFTGDVVLTDGTRRLVSTFGSPNSAALQLGRALPFALGYILLPLSEWRRYWGASAFLIMLTAALLTQSVGFLVLGFPVAVGIMVLGWRGRRAVLPLMGLGVLGLAIFVPLIQVFPRLRRLLDFENSTIGFRVYVWRSALQMIEDHPLTGVGLDQFLYAYRSRYILPEAWEDPDLSHPHNIVLDYWVRLGILGVALGFGFQVAFWWTALHVYRRVRHGDRLLWGLLLGAMGSMAYTLAHGLIDSAHFAINLSYFFALTLALVYRLTQVEKESSVMNMEAIVNGMVIRLMQGDITEANTEAITNAANSSLLLGDGVAGAIYDKGGPIIQQECNAIGHCPVGKAVLTGAGKLKAKYVIHAVGPRMGEGDEHNKLQSAVLSTLQLAEESKVRSIALPAISTGIFGFPMQDAAQIMARVILNYSFETREHLHTIEVYLYDSKAYKTFLSAFQTELDAIEDSQKTSTLMIDEVDNGAETK